MTNKITNENLMVCEICNDKELGVPAYYRCTNCDKFACKECWDSLGGDDNKKDCDTCPGCLYK